jgi:phosphomannomutase
VKDLVVFDLDGTLAPSKSPIDAEMGTLLQRLLAIVRVAIISGGDFAQFQTQVLDRIPAGSAFGNLALLPTTGTKFYTYNGAWQKIYSDDLTDAEKSDVEQSIDKAVDESGFQPKESWGPRIEDRGTQITYSALGQQAPLDAKEQWDPDFRKRQKIKALLDPMLPNFSVRLGGTTSIDVTRAGVDKGYGIRKLRDVLGIPIERMLFVGDAIFPGGNDYAAMQAGAPSIKVRDPEDTKRVIETIVAWST